MPKIEKTPRLASDKSSGAWQQDPSIFGKKAKESAASALTQRLAKTSGASLRVIKETSSTHRDALKRLVDR